MDGPLGNEVADAPRVSDSLVEAISEAIADLAHRFYLDDPKAGLEDIARAAAEVAEEHYRPRIEELGRAIGVLSDTVHELQCRQPGLTQPAADPRTFGPDHHDFLPVREHSDDDECTYRSDGTDATYCGLIRARHELWSPGAGE